MALSTEKKVGLFFILGLILFGVMLELGGQWNPFERSIPYKTFLTSVTGLKVGDSVRLAGVDVGKINGIDVLEGKVRIDFDVKKGTKIRTRFCCKSSHDQSSGRAVPRYFLRFADSARSSSRSNGCE